MRTRILLVVSVALIFIATPRRAYSDHIQGGPPHPDSFWFEIVTPVDLFSVDIPVFDLGDFFLGIVPLFGPGMGTVIDLNAVVEFNGLGFGGPTLAIQSRALFFGFAELFPLAGFWTLGDNTSLELARGTTATIFIEAHSSEPVPEPATSVLLLSGLAMVGLAKRKRTGGKRRSSRL